MQKPCCVSSRCHMSTDDVSHVKVRLQPREVAVDELCIREGMRHGWEDTDGDKKMYEYKSTARWGEAARVERDQIELKVWNESKLQKPEKQEQLDQSEIGIQSWRRSPVPCLPFIPGACRHLLPHPLSCLRISTKILSSCLHPMYSFPIHRQDHLQTYKH